MIDKELMEMAWQDFKQAIILKSPTPGQERFVKDVFFAGAWALWGIVTYIVPEKSDDEGAAIMEKLDDEFAAFFKERLKKLMETPGNMIKTEDWP